jgi:hypothetical protein
VRDRDALHGEVAATREDRRVVAAVQQARRRPACSGAASALRPRRSALVTGAGRRRGTRRVTAVRLAK